jgi:hypothetical protein
MMADYIAIDKEFLKEILSFLDDNEFLESCRHGLGLIEKRHQIAMRLIPMIRRGAEIPVFIAQEEDSLEMKDEIPWGPTEWRG